MYILLISLFLRSLWENFCHFGKVFESYFSQNPLVSCSGWWHTDKVYIVLLQELPLFMSVRDLAIFTYSSLFKWYSYFISYVALYYFKKKKLSLSISILLTDIKNNLVTWLKLCISVLSCNHMVWIPHFVIPQCRYVWAEGV